VSSGIEIVMRLKLSLLVSFDTRRRIAGRIPSMKKKEKVHTAWAKKSKHVRVGHGHA
jgi:hypothetical protein